MPQLTVLRFPSRADLDAALAQRLEQALTHADDGTPFAVMLSGGSTPLQAYRALAARTPRPADRLHLLYSDERYVPADSEASNYRQSRPLLDALGLPEERVLRVRTELPLDEAAADYERRLDVLWHAGASIRLGLLGLGADGHTASLFRPSDLQRAQGHRAMAVQRPDGRAAVTVTPALLTRIREPVFVVAGTDKRNALSAFLAGSEESVAWRAVSACSSVHVWTDLPTGS